MMHNEPKSINRLEPEAGRPPGGPGPRIPWNERREWFRQHWMELGVAGVPDEEIRAQFETMPPRYWEKVAAGDFVWGLEVIHRFFHELSQPNGGSSAMVIDWRETTEKGLFKVMLSTWDRQGLLAKAAAAFSAVGCGILQAEAYTRSDHVVLDMFLIRDSAPRPTGRWQEIKFLIEGALSQPPRFASVWACSRHRHLAEPSEIPVRVLIENQSGQDWTRVRIEASDRLGLLYDVLQAIADADLNLCEAVIHTEGGAAADIFYVTTRDGNKLSDAGVINDLRQRLNNALTING